MNPAAGGNLANLAATISTPRVMIGLALLAWMYGMPTNSQRIAKTHGACQGKWCDATNMWVDTPERTQMLDESMGAGMLVRKTPATPQMVYQNLTSKYMMDQALSPGVRLVAHAVR